MIAEAVGINHRMGIHSARHTFATVALSKGMPFPYVSKLMGRSDLKTTAIYAQIIDTALDEAT